MEKYILDANLFFNMQAGLGLGQKTEEVVLNITKTAKKLRNEGKAEFLMPSKVLDEFLSFFEDKNQQFIKDFISVLTIKTPDVSIVNLPAQLFYELINEIRQRSYRGLVIGEEEVVRAGQLMSGCGELDKKSFQIKIGGVIKTFRDRYRHATRFGFLDSLADLDLIMLSKEQNGYLISSDEGVVYWGRIFGVKEIPVAVWRERLNDLLGAHHQV